MSVNNKKIFIFLPLLVIPCVSIASHHFESVGSLKDTRLAQVDNYIFQSDRKDHTAIIMTVNYDPKKGENKTFNPDALYKIHLASDIELQNGKTLSVKFNKNKYFIYEIDNANPKPGTIGTLLGEGEINKKNIFNNGIITYAGIVKDPFYGNSNSLTTFHKDYNDGKPYDKNVWKNANGKSIFIGRQVGSIVLDIPNEMLSEEVHSFFTTDVKENTNWKQVQYSAIPLLSHTMLNNSLLREAHNVHRPNMEYNNELKQFISASILRSITLADTKKDNPIKYADNTATSLVPDVLSYKIGTPASFTVDKINGRALKDDIMSVMLTKLLGVDTDQSISDPKEYTVHFPYVIPVN